MAQVAGATGLVAAMAVTLRTFIPDGGVIAIGAVAFTVATWVACLAIAPSVEVRRLGPVPVAARLSEGAVKAHCRSAAPEVKAWAGACLAAAAVIAVAGGRLAPTGKHGMVRPLNHADQMTNLRFGLLVATAMLVIGALLSSGVDRR
jgi:hypothetical protein